MSNRWKTLILGCVLMVIPGCKFSCEGDSSDVGEEIEDSIEEIGDEIEDATE